MHELKTRIGDDVYAIEIPYESDVSHAIYSAFDWYGDGEVDDQNRTLTAPGCFYDAENPEDIVYNWPDPEAYIDQKECLRRVEMAPEGKVVLGILWSSHFQDTCASFGMETALMNMLTAPELVRKFVLPGCRKLVEQAHNYGIKVIYHSCGSIEEIIPDLIEAGIDALHPIQTLAAGMQPESLKEKYGDRLSFCGGIDTQNLLVKKTSEEVRTEVERLCRLFPTGLILSPSHEAILPDVHPANIAAIFAAVQTYAAEREK